MPRPTIAIVAVHGVADQQPGESARAIAAELLRTRDSSEPHYTSFRELPLHLPLDPIRFPALDAAPDSARDRFRERLRPRAAPSDAPAGAAPDDISDRLMRAMLQNYAPPHGSGVYDSLRLEGARVEPGGGPAEAEIHIYESYWADLSRVGSGWLEILGDFYQLLLHLPYIGQQVLESIGETAPAALRPRWTRVAQVYTLALRLLTVGIPMLNLMLVGLTIPLLPSLFRGYELQAATALFSLGLGLVTGFKTYGARRGPTLVRWILAWSAGGLSIGLTLALLHLQFTVEHLLIPILALSFWFLGAMPFDRVLRVFERQRPGALIIGRCAYIATTVVLIGFIVSKQATWDGVASAVVTTSELLYICLSVVWLVFFLLVTMIVLVGWLARPLGLSAEHRDRGSRALLTARLSLALSAWLFLLVSLLLSVLLVYLAGQFGAVRDLQDQLLLLPCAENGGELAHRYASCVLSLSAPIVTPGMLALVLGLGIILWAFGPSAWAELRPARNVEDAAAAERLGAWLTLGYRILRVGGEVLCLALPAGAVLAILPLLNLHLVPFFSGREWLGATEQLLWNVAGGLAGAAAGSILLSRVVEGAALGLRPALDVVLDVDNYMREQPRTGTPRAQIAERFASLLRYLCRWKNTSAEPGAPGYGAVIVVAHSQGTVIAADLFRFLERERRRQPGFEPDLARLSATTEDPTPLPVVFLTMGCPLRQLYALRFPVLYGWVLDGLSPETLGLHSWVNLYRSGDYIGRSLWADPAQLESFDPGEELATMRTKERCIGAGAHTHYWDETAPAVAQELDELVRQAVARTTS